MIIIRPIKKQDLDVFAEFSFESLLGITNLSRDRDKLTEKIGRSETFLQQDIQKPGNEEYYFVLEDLATGRIGGICGILANSGLSRDFFYKCETVPTQSKHISAPKEIHLLKIVTNKSNASEVCSLYLQRTFRHSGQGRLLSLSRFLFIASHRSRFRKKFVAELRGFIDERQISPFWEGVGRYFCNLSFVELMTQLDQDRTFIAEILPKYPLYVALLPPEVQAAIGKTHESSKPAMTMLTQEGFKLTSEIDIFDGGPSLEAETGKIRSISNSARVKVSFTDESLTDEQDYILSNERLADFRACFGKLQFISKNNALINKEVAEALLIQSGDTIRYVTPHP